MADENENQTNDEQGQPDPSLQQGGDGAPQSAPEGDANGNTEATQTDDSPEISPANSGLGTSLDAQTVKAEQDERASQVKYSAATYTVPEDGYTFADVADATGLARQDLDELVSLNSGYEFGIRTSFVKGDKVDLPRRFSYVDVKGVRGGNPVDE